MGIENIKKCDRKFKIRNNKCYEVRSAASISCKDAQCFQNIISKIIKRNRIKRKVVEKNQRPQFKLKSAAVRIFRSMLVKYNTNPIRSIFC